MKTVISMWFLLMCVLGCLVIERLAFADSRLPGDFSATREEPQVAEIIVKMKAAAQGPVQEGTPSVLTAEDLAALNFAAGVALTPSWQHRDGSCVLRLPSPIGLHDARLVVNAMRMLPQVLYAEPVPMRQTDQTFTAQSRSGTPIEPARITQIVVKLRDPQSWEDAAQSRPIADATLQELSRITGVTLTYDRPMSGGAYVLNLPTPLSLAQATALTERLEASALVEYADPVTHMRRSVVPNDTHYGLQWQYFEAAGGVNLQAAWDLTVGSPGVVVAVVDSGILPNHPDLTGRLLPGYDFITDVSTANDGNGRDTNPTDPGDAVVVDECGSGKPGTPSSWHGTHIAGTIGAASFNGVGVTGSNWRSPILPLRALGKCGGSAVDIADAIRWAVGRPVPGVPLNPHPARGINLSFAGDSLNCPAVEQIAINDALAAGAAVVVAAGNEETSAALFTPGNCNGVIVVHATTRTGSFAPYSNFGEVVDISAPGGLGDVVSSGPLGTRPYDAILSTGGSGATTLTSHTYTFKDGTSMASAHTSGVASLVFSANPSLSASQVEAILTTTARAFPSVPGGTCSPADCGTGIVDAFAAVSATPHPATPDFDRTTLSDIPLRHSSGLAAVWLMDGAAIISAGIVGSPGDQWHIADTGDLNADGRSDVILRHVSGLIGVWLMNGTTVTNAVVVGNLDLAWQIVGAGDMNADGMADLIFRHEGGTIVVWLMNGGTLSSAGVVGSPGSAWQVVGIGDFNNDRHADLVLRHSNGTVAMWLMNGTAIVNAGVAAGLDLAWEVAGTGDFNGDRRSDVVLRHSSGAVAIWLMDGTAIAGAGVAGNPGTSWQVVGTGDLNGDTLWDIVLRHASGTVAGWFMNGTTIGGAGVIGGLELSWQVVGMR